VADLTDVARRIASAYAALDPGWIRSHLSALLGRIGISLSPTGPTLTVGARPPRGDVQSVETVIYELLDLPLALYERDEASTLVVFDEFQDLLVARKDLDGLLRPVSCITATRPSTYSRDRSRR
jgi:hypothetical protein